MNNNDELLDRLLNGLANLDTFERERLLHVLKAVVEDGCDMARMLADLDVEISAHRFTASETRFF